VNISRYYYKLTTKVPIKELVFSVEDFSKGMRWAKSLPHPFISSMSLYDYFYRWESAEILAYLNNLIRDHKKTIE
jgi:hypothetical protein